MKFFANLIITALLLCFVFPAVTDGGVQFHGSFWPTGVLYAFIFGIVSTLTTLGIFLATGVITIATRGLALLAIVPAFILGFWLLPAVQLQVFAHYFPAHFTVSSWGAAIVAGFVMMVVNMVLSGKENAEALNRLRTDLRRS